MNHRKNTSNVATYYSFAEKYFYFESGKNFTWQEEKWPLLEPCVFLGAEIHNFEKTVRKITILYKNIAEMGAHSRIKF